MPLADTLQHYWLGTKLLWSEIKLASSILTRLLHGHGMSRRESKQVRSQPSPFPATSHLLTPSSLGNPPS